MSHPLPPSAEQGKDLLQDQATQFTIAQAQQALDRSRSASRRTGDEPVSNPTTSRASTASPEESRMESRMESQVESRVEPRTDSGTDWSEPEAPSTAARESVYEQTRWQILLDGKPIHRVVSFQLDQAFNDHHRFTLRVYHTELEEPRTYRIDQTRDLLGQPLTAILGSHLQEDRVEFTGIITQVSFEQARGLNGEVVLSGYSPTILLESGGHLQSFYQKNLQIIAQEVTESLSGKLELALRPRYTQSIPYVTQHEETSFAFLLRLASWYGEWCYYDGRRFRLGRPDQLPTHKLYYGRHIEDLKMEMRVLPMEFTHISYQSSSDQVLSYQPDKRVEGLNFYGDLAVEKSGQVFPRPVKNKPVQRAGDLGALMHVATVNKASTAGGTFTLTGSCKSPYLSPGCKITIYMGETELGEFLVTQVRHRLSVGSHYESEFTALAGDIQVIPTPARSAPPAEPQLAVVRKNDDPQGQGRVRVQFQWQEGDQLTDWIRVLTPDAGGGGEKVAKNRGFVFIPEVGDLVVVAFRDGNIDAPYVQGSLFHGKVGSGGGQGNKTKSLTTRSGSTVTLDDQAQTVTVMTSPDARLHLDNAGHITIQAKTSFSVHCGESSFEMKADGSIVLKGKTLTLEGATQVDLNTGEGQVNLGNAGKDVTIKGQNISLTGQNNHISGKSTLDGGDVFIN